ncbi:hypothetical protein KCU92_g6635, partial [Aureobasidium melanogenum]
MSTQQQSAVKPASGAVSTPNKWPSREHFQETVTLIVGDEKKPYVVHKDLLCFYSDYFRAAFQGSFKEATERKVELPGVIKDVFEHFQVWLYTRRLDFADTQFHTIIRLWIFGDQHQIPLLQNWAADSLIAKRKKEHTFPISLVPLVYENTVAKSALRKVVIEIATTLQLQDGTGTYLILEHWSVESLIDLVRAVDIRPKNLGQYNLPVRDKCFFHLHNKGEHC